MLLSRYGNIDHVLRLPVNRAFKLVKIATKEKRKEYYYAQWLMHLTRMTKDTFIPFNEWYEDTEVRIDLRPRGDILNDILGMEKDD